MDLGSQDLLQVSLPIPCNYPPIHAYNTPPPPKAIGGFEEPKPNPDQPNAEDQNIRLPQVAWHETHTEQQQQQQSETEEAKQPCRSAPTKKVVRYRECRKNQAATIGGYAIDGCGEFMSSTEDGVPALQCAACHCHRNFHRREVEGENTSGCPHTRK